MYKKIFVLMPLFALLLVGCGCGSKKEATEENKAEEKGNQEEGLGFELPKPSKVLSEEAQMEYMAEHYWDKFDFADTAYLQSSQKIDMAFVGYLDLLFIIPKEQGEEYFATFWERAQTNKQLYSHFIELGENQLYDPNSPYRNEELYVTMLNSVIGSELLSDLEKLRAKEHLRMAMKNRVGSKAANLTFTLADGSSLNLYDVEASFTLIYFINPGCAGCAEYSTAIAHSQILDPLIVSGDMKVLLLYPDEELKAWREDLDRVPEQWTYGYDKELAVRNKELYELRAIPTLYLLDSNKKVLIKDAKGVGEIEHFIYYNVTR